VARRREPLGDAGKKLDVVRAAARHAYPTSDIDRMLSEIESGYGIAERARLVTDAEVLQEILQRYVAINRRDAIQSAFDALLGIVDQVFAIEQSAAERAKSIVLGHSQLSARDALHIAVMEQQRIEQILSFDAGFDGFPGIARLH
jgi:predicted nucleic acid-binding protein